MSLLPAAKQWRLLTFKRQWIWRIIVAMMNVVMITVGSQNKKNTCQVQTISGGLVKFPPRPKNNDDEEGYINMMKITSFSSSFKLWGRPNDGWNKLLFWHLLLASTTSLYTSTHPVGKSECVKILAVSNRKAKTLQDKTKPSIIFLISRFEDG